MLKLANPDFKTLLSGLGSSAAVGAGVGALGMGAANYLGPNPDPNDPTQKKQSILKSMLLGATLGGITGGGIRAFADRNPNYSSDPGPGLNQLAQSLSSKPAPHATPPPTPYAVLGGSPVIDAGLAGTGTTVASRFYNKPGENAKKSGAGFNIAESRLKSSPSYTAANEIGKEKLMNDLINKSKFTKPLGHGLLAGGTTLGLGEILNQQLQNRAKYDDFNTSPGIKSLFDPASQ